MFRDFWLALLAGLLPNLAFFGISQWLGVGRPWFNLDYALVMLLLAFGWRWLGGVLGVGLLLVDVLALGGQVLPFVRLSEVLYLMRFSASASIFHQVLLVIVCLLVVLHYYILVSIGRRLSRYAALSMFNLLALFAAFQSNLSIADGRFYRQNAGAWVESQAVAFFRGRSDVFLDSFQAQGPALVRGPGVRATMAWMPVSDRFSDKRLLLILAESWGVPVDGRIQAALLSPLQRVPAQPIEIGSLAFAGVTLDAELRELCLLSVRHYNLSETNDGFDECLPNQLKKSGYTTAAMHGAVSSMYDRRYWYPRAGFERAIFFEDRLWPRRCYSFPGACDLDLFTEVEVFFSQPGKRFFYWLTLNSHAHYDSRDIHVDVFDCESFSISEGSESCRNLKLQAQFFSGLASLLRSKEMRGVDVIVVGDHSPVILDLNEKKRNFVENVVPWVRIRTL